MSRVSGKGQEGSATTRQKRVRTAQDASATANAFKSKRVRFNEDAQDGAFTHQPSESASQQQVPSSHSKSHGKQQTASKPEEADQHSVVHAAKPSKRPTNAHAKYAARTRARAKCCTSSLAQQQPMVYGANAQDPAGEGCHTAQQPSIAASTRAVRQKGSSTSDAGDPVGVAVHSYSAHQASTIASSRAAGKNSSKAHAQDSACEAFQTACDQLPAHTFLTQQRLTPQRAVTLTERNPLPPGPAQHTGH